MDAQKKILVVCQHFWPEEFRINDLCVSLVELGYQIDVVCDIPNYPQGKFFKGYSMFKKRVEVYNGINIYRTFVVPRGKGNPLQVFLNYISFPINSFYRIWKLSKNDYSKILVYQLTPAFMAYPALFMKRLIKKEVYIYIQDLWPESLYSVYSFKSRIYKYIFNKISDNIYKKCDYYMTTSKGIKQRLQDKYGIGKEKILYLPNWAEKLYEEKKENIDLNSKYDDTFNIMFAGNLGPAQSLETLIEAAKICFDKGYKDIKWIFVGDGMTRAAAEHMVKEKEITQVVDFLGRKPVSSMPEYYNISDALIVSLVKTDLFSITIPSKIQSYLAAAKPILASLDGEGARIIQESGSGFTCESQNAEKLSDIVVKMYKLSKQEREKMGHNGRQYYVENFEKEVLLSKLTAFLFKTNKLANE
jgi:colanic acid biosynthesis glycosyl transferase WcaI